MKWIGLWGGRGRGAPGFRFMEAGLFGPNMLRGPFLSMAHAWLAHTCYRTRGLLFEFVDGGLDFVGVELGEDGAVLAGGRAFEEGRGSWGRRVGR